MPKINSTPPSSDPLALRPYQKIGIEWLRKTGSALLADEMGLGKSRMLIEASQGKTLVVMPSMLLDSGSWAGEVRKWADDPDRFTFVAWHQLHQTARVLKVPKNQRHRPPEEQTPKWITEHYPLLEEALDHEWDTVILDEAHNVKNAKANRTGAIKRLRRCTPNWYMATGTPVPNWAHELFTPLQLLWPDKANPSKQFGSKNRWEREWFFVAQNRYAPPGVYDIGGLRRCSPGCRTADPSNPCEHFTEFAQANLGDRFLQRLAIDVQKDLPPIVEDEVLVPLTSKQWRAYKEMRDKQLTQLREEDEEPLTAWYRSSRWTYMDRISTGLGLADGRVDIQESGKLERLRFDLERRTRPTLIMCHYRNSVEACYLVAQEMGLRASFVHGGADAAQRAEAVQGFQEGRLDVLVGSIDTLAEGLTLTAADMVIFVEKSWRNHKNDQAKKRIHRMGQTRHCYVLDYVAVSPTGDPILDTHKREVLAEKSEEQVRTLSAARRMNLL
jgi:SNF2 family DNA or RNA helicase